MSWRRCWAYRPALQLRAAPASQTLCLLGWASWVIVLSPHSKIHPSMIRQLPMTVQVDREEPCVNLLMASWMTQTSRTQECVSIHMCPPSTPHSTSPPRYTPITRVRGPAAVRTLAQPPNTHDLKMLHIPSQPSFNLFLEIVRMFFLFQNKYNGTELQLRELIIVFHFKFTSS